MGTSGIAKKIDGARAKTVRVLSPQELMEWLAARPFRQDLCIECGAGRGEIGSFMSGRFRRVLLLDKAVPHMRVEHPGVQWIEASAEQIPLEAESADLLISMQALHHFDVPRHVQEAERVLRPGGVFAALAWGAIELPAPIADAYSATCRSVEPFWEEARPWAISGYAGLKFAGTPIPAPPAAMVKRWTASDLEREIASWSATQEALRRDAEIIDPDLGALGLSPADQFDVRWPIVGKFFRRS